MFVIELQTLEPVDINNYGTAQPTDEPDAIVLLETDTGIVAISRHNIHKVTFAYFKKRFLTRPEYNYLTNSENKIFSPTISDLAETTGAVTADGFWMTLNWLFAALPFTQGDFLADMGEWGFNGFSIGVIPAILAIVTPVVTTIRYCYWMRSWPNGSEMADIIIATCATTFKYTLGVIGWCFSSSLFSFVIPIALHSIGLTSSAFASPLSYIALGAGIGIGTGVALASYHIGACILNHFLERTPASKHAVGFFANIFAALNPRNYQIKQNRGVFDWQNLVLGALKEFVMGFAGGVTWFAASLIPGGLAALPGMKPLVVVIIQPLVSTVAAIIGSLVTAKLLPLGISKLIGFFKNRRDIAQPGILTKFSPIKPVFKPKLSAVIKQSTAMICRQIGFPLLPIHTPLPTYLAPRRAPQRQDQTSKADQETEDSDGYKRSNRHH